MVRIYRFQRRSFSFAQKIPQTYGGKLENYGVVFVTSADPTLSRPQRRMQVKEIAERIQRFAMEELGGPVLVGIGETVVSGEPLNESYRQAVLALHLGRESGKNMIWYGPIGNEKSEGISAILRLLGELRKRLESASYSGLEAVVDEFLEQVLISSLRNPEEIRRHLQYGLIQLLEAVKGRGDLSEGEASDFQGNLIRSLEKAGTTQEMVLAFKDSFERLISLTSGKGTLQAAYSIQKVRDYAADHFREQLKMTRLAKLAGVSVATLSRHFKKATGVGFEIYLQNLRLEEARRLLKTGSLPVAQVARACGFKAGSHFARFFRKKTGFSPQQFRDKSQRL
jgi:two-component system response regulator YesN